MDNFSKRLKEERDRLEMTQEQVAELLKFTKNTIYRWESGRVTPHPAVQDSVLATLQLIPTRIIKKYSD